MNQPIIDEIRKTRDAHAAKFNYNLDAIFRDLREREKASGQPTVSYPPRKPEVMVPIEAGEECPS